MSAAPDRLPRRAFSRAGHPILVLDPDRGAVRYANRCACSLLGYGVDELLALSVSAIFPEEGDALEAFLEEIVKQGEGSTTTLALRSKSGGSVPAELFAVRFRTDGQRYVLVLVRTRRDDRANLV